jgi:hypothetical protein
MFAAPKHSFAGGNTHGLSIGQAAVWTDNNPANEKHIVWQQYQKGINNGKEK